MLIWTLWCWQGANKCYQDTNKNRKRSTNPKILDPRKPGVLDKLGLVHKSIFVPMIGTEIKIFGCTKNISMLFSHSLSNIQELYWLKQRKAAIRVIRPGPNGPILPALELTHSTSTQADTKSTLSEGSLVTKICIANGCIYRSQQPVWLTQPSSKQVETMSTILIKLFRLTLFQISIWSNFFTFDLKLSDGDGRCIT